MLFDREVALTPSVGGACIIPAALSVADIIVSTTSAISSMGIRTATWADVSHASLYVGGGEFVEAVEQGVRRRKVDEYLAEATLAVAYRSPHLTAVKSKVIANWTINQIRSNYNSWSAARSALKCNLEGARPTGFFCSQLIVEAFKQADLSITKLPSECISPGELVDIAMQGLVYVGHLKGNPMIFPRHKR